MPHNRNLGIPDNSEVIIERSNPLRPYDFCCIEAVRIDKDGRFYFELPSGGRRYLYGRENGTE